MTTKQSLFSRLWKYIKRSWLVTLTLAIRIFKHTKGKVDKGLNLLIHLPNRQFGIIGRNWNWKPKSLHARKKTEKLTYMEAFLKRNGRVRVSEQALFFTCAAEQSSKRVYIKLCSLLWVTMARIFFDFFHLSCHESDKKRILNLLEKVSRFEFFVSQWLNFKQRSSNPMVWGAIVFEKLACVIVPCSG